jgi:hypothetical protein
MNKSVSSNSKDHPYRANGADSKDPAPNASNSQRKGGGNDPAPAGDEKLNQAKAERVSAASRFDLNKPGPEQPTRTGGDGNAPIAQAVEGHNQKKAEYIKASQRF